MKNKKGLSVVIGYVLLIVISIVMSILVYQWLKTYVPTEALECSDGTSLFIKDVYYDCANQKLNITLENNGKFGINGYYIHASNKSGENLSTIDLSNNITYGGNKTSNSVVFSLYSGSTRPYNLLTPDEPGNTWVSTFDVSDYGTIYRIEIIPIRVQEVSNKNRSVACSNAKVIDDNIACAT